MSRPANAVKVAGMGAACGFAFFGAEELLSLLLRQPPLDVGDLARLLPIYVGVGGALGLALGLASVRGIAAALWLWASFTAVLLSGPIGAALSSVGVPAPVGVLLALALMGAAAIGLLFLTRDKDDLRWGALAGAWVTTVFAGVVNARVGGDSAIANGLLSAGALVIGASLALALGKSLGGRAPKAGVFAALVGILLWAGRVPALNLVEVPLPTAASSGSAAPPLVFVIVSGLRADRLSFFASGDGAPTTPALDELAATSIAYEHAHAAAPWSLPAVSSLLTAQLPSRHHAGLRQAEGAPSRRLTDENRTLAEYLSKAGLRTVSLVSEGSLGADAGLDQGVDHHELLYGLGRLPLLLPTLDMLGLDLFPARDHAPAKLIVDRAIQIMPALGKGAWMLTVQLGDLHWALATEEGDAEARYDDAVRAVDAELGRLLHAAPNEAWIVVVGDHGVSLGEHSGAYPGVSRPEGVYSGDTLFQEQLRVPLLVHRPRNLRPVSVLRPVRAYDIMPTVLEIMGVKLLTSIDGAPLDEALGRSAPAEDEAVISEAVRYGPERTAVRRSEWKLIESGEGDELYNLFLDPGEENNVAAEHEKLVEDLGYELPGRTRPQDRPRMPIEILERYEDQDSYPELNEDGSVKQPDLEGVEGAEAGTAAEGEQPEAP